MLAPLAKVAQRALLDRFAPASVLIDRNGRALWFHGSTGDYLEPPPGEPSRDLLLMARDGLRSKLRIALRQAKQTPHAPVRAEARMKRVSTGELDRFIRDVIDGSISAPSPFNLPQDQFAALESPFGPIPGVVYVQDPACVAFGYYRTRNSGLCSTKTDLLSRDMFSEERRKQGLATWTHAFHPTDTWSSAGGDFDWRLRVRPAAGGAAGGAAG